MQKRAYSKPDLQAVTVEELTPETSSIEAPVSFFKLMCDIYPTLPYKFFIYLGFRCHYGSPDQLGRQVRA